MGSMFYCNHTFRSLELVPQTVINRNVQDALKVLNARLGNLQNRTRTFDWEFASMDPDNPITQVSKTPSDAEFPCDWDDEDNEMNKEINSCPNTPRTPSDCKG
ncbi:uncharacterized protein CDAR_99421 [Caerostris darwini]|uniref:Uncharacterized protein n=1 Tax=Caerostris darwini TaxID=1538125 RepID=A0AAV4UMY3_9ARAC|nr:uncharacterized protein CDAR_99421 [Caerostris darwini]